MDPQPSSVPEPQPRGLPPVTPPSGRFIAQLFLVPGMIVLVAVLLLLAFRYLLGGGYTPESFLRQLDSDNADIRWRGASDLAQVLKRQESIHLRSDAKFALDLAQRLRTALDDLVLEEKKLQEQAAKLPAEQAKTVWRKLKTQRDHVSYLSAALGDFVIPSALPLLAEIIERVDSPDTNGNLQRRRQAVYTLGNLGNNMRGFAKLPPEQQKQILDYLVEQAQGSEPRATWARHGLYHLDRSRLPSGTTALVEVDRVLAKAADDDDRYLREWTAVALIFWDGPLVEPTLHKLARDDGHGALVRIPEGD